MLNDLLTIERGLTAAGIDFGAAHPDVKDMAKGRALRVRLGAGGRVSSVEIVPEAGRGALWTLRDGQHNGFPGLKTAGGLLAMDKVAVEEHSRLWESDKVASRRRDELRRLFANLSLDRDQILKWPNAGHRRRIGERLAALQALADDPRTASVPAVFERFLQALDATPSFLEALAAALSERVEQGREEWLDPVREALIGPVPLAIDVAGFPRDAGDPRQVGPVSAALSAADAGSRQTDASGGVCALTGKAATLHRGNFPQPNLPGLGQTYIFSRNSDIPSLARYGRTADASFPIDSGLVTRLSGAVGKLTRDEAKGKTWRLIPAESGDKPDLLITSLPARPEAELANVLAGDDDEEVDAEAALEHLGSQLIGQVEGELTTARPVEPVTILIFRTVDPANRKTIYHRDTTSKDFWEAAQRWREATKNTPGWLGLPVPVKGQAAARRLGPPYVKPLSLVGASRTLFANGGQRRVSVIGVTSAEAFRLFLREGDVGRRVRRLLRLLLQRHGALISGLAEARTKGMDHLKKFDPGPKADLRRDALRSLTWIGALLHHLGHTAERNPEMSGQTTYVDDLAFRLGQFLSAADMIHVGYCADLRGGDVPPTLLGNSVLSVAGADPVRALSILQTRLKPYLAWAKRADLIFTKASKAETTGDRNTAIALRQGVSQARRADELAVEIHNLLTPYRNKEKRPDDAFKAELLLGYMAGLPPLKKQVGSDPTQGRTHDNANVGEHQ